MTLHIFRMTFALFIDAVPLTMTASNPCLIPDVIIEANRRDSELECTSCASMKLLSAVVNCEHTAAQVGLPSCPTDKAQKR